MPLTPAVPRAAATVAGCKPGTGAVIAAINPPATPEDRNAFT